MSVIVGFKISPSLKKFMEKYAKEEKRSLSNFIVMCVLNHIEKHYGKKWNDSLHKDEDKPNQSP